VEADEVALVERQRCGELELLGCANTISLQIGKIAEADQVCAPHASACAFVGAISGPGLRAAPPRNSGWRARTSSVGRRRLLLIGEKALAATRAEEIVNVAVCVSRYLVAFGSGRTLKLRYA
jgi:hypothetical protein